MLQSVLSNPRQPVDCKFTDSGFCVFTKFIILLQISDMTFRMYNTEIKTKYSPINPVATSVMHLYVFDFRLCKT